MTAAEMRARYEQRRAWNLCVTCGKRLHARSISAGRSTCGECRRIARVRYRRQRVRYEPIEDILARPHVRILRQLRWFDWVTADSLWVALDVEDKDERLSYSATLSYLVRQGLVEKRSDHWPHEYRITSAGRAAAQRPVHEYERRMGERA